MLYGLQLIINYVIGQIVLYILHRFSVLTFTDIMMHC